MAGEDREAKVVLRYTIDETSTRQVAQSTKAVQTQVAALATQVERLSPTARASVRGMEGEFNRLDRQVNESSQKVRSLESDLRQVGQLDVRPRVSIQQSGLSRQGAGEAADRLGSIGAQIVGGFGQSEAANVLGLIGDFGGAIGSLNPVLLAGTAATVGLSLVLGEATRKTQEVTEATTRRLQAEEEAIRFLQTATTQATRERIRQIEADIAEERAVLLRNALERGELVDYLATYPLEGLRATLGLAYGELKAFDEQIKGNNQTIATLEDQLRQLQEGLEGNTVAANDARAAIRSYSERLVNAGQEIISLFADVFAYEREQAQKAAQERRTQIFQEATAGINAFINRVVQVGQFATQTAQILNTSNAEIAKFNQQQEKELSALNTRLQEQLASLGEAYLDEDRKADNTALTQLREFHQDEQNRTKEHQQALRRIARDGDTAIADAAADRNIRAALEAERNTQTQLRDETERFNLTSEQRQQDLDALKENIAEEDRERYNTYRKRYNDLIAQNQRESNAILSKYSEQISLTRQAYSQQYSDLRTALINENALRQQANNAFVQGAANVLNAIRGLFSGASASILIPQTVTLTTQQARDLGFLPRAIGGVTAASRLVRLNERGVESGMTDAGEFSIFTRPTTVFTADETRALLGGLQHYLQRPSGGGLMVDVGGIHTVVNGANGDPDAIARRVEERVVVGIERAVSALRGQASAVYTPYGAPS